MVMFETTRNQGDHGVAQALAYYASQGWPVSVPFGEGQRYDLIVDRGGVLSRVQCKSTLSKVRSGSYQAELRPRGGNRSGAGKVSRLSASEIEEVLIVDGEGGLWLFPSSELDGRSTITLGAHVRHRRVL